MQSFIRGQRTKLSQISGLTRQFYLHIALSSPRVPVFDFVCFGVDERGHLSDDRYMVFFNQMRSPEGAIVLENLTDQGAQFLVDLDLVPPTVSRLVFTVSVDGIGAMTDLGPCSLQLGDGTASLQPLLEFRFSGADFQTETALMLAEIYRKDGEWRFWAQGQGFAGNLAALLAHFGGQEEQGTISQSQSQSQSQSSSPTPAPPPAQPSPPLSAPTAASIIVTPPPAASGRIDNALQKAIADAPSGSTLKLARGEFQGPVTIDKPLVLDGSDAVIWAQNGPVVRVSSAGVTLRDLEIEATAPDPSPHFDVALWVDNGANIVLQNVRVRGEIVGVPAAQGEWKLPPVLNLGRFAARQSNSFGFEVEVPQSCDLKINIAGISVLPHRLDAGRSQVEVQVSGIGADIFLAGHIELLSGGVGRTIPLTGHSASGVSPAQNVLLWNVDNP
jgi:stress response protein SCP2